MRFEKPNEIAGLENRFRKWCSYQEQLLFICEQMKDSGGEGLSAQTMRSALVRAFTMAIVEPIIRLRHRQPGR